MNLDYIYIFKSYLNNNVEIEYIEFNKESWD
jgi:hypothetical protein